MLKPGATVYDAFWLRDGSYLSVALDVAGLASDAERSLRLFWQPGSGRHARRRWDSRLRARGSVR